MLAQKGHNLIMYLVLSTLLSTNQAYGFVNIYVSTYLARVSVQSK